MQMKMLVRIGVVQRQAGGRERFELGTESPAPPGGAQRRWRPVAAQCRKPVRKRPEASTSSGTRAGSSTGRAPLSVTCKPTRKPGSPACPLDRVTRRRLPHHQAGRGEHTPLLNAFLDRLVDRRSRPKSSAVTITCISGGEDSIKSAKLRRCDGSGSA